MPAIELSDCYFYHTVELPGLGVQRGEWDLRDGVDDYLGHVPLAGKRVLEVGTANGFLCFAMEQRGADVVAYDLGEGDEWDLVPFDGVVPEEQRAERRALARRLNNAWRFTHDLLGSSATAVHGTVYEISESNVGPVDVATFGSVLLHVRDPFLALQRACALVRETVIVTDVLAVAPPPEQPTFWQRVRGVPRREPDPVPEIMFLPDAAVRGPIDTWWRLSPNLIRRYLWILGFVDQTLTHHEQTFHHPETHQIPMYTVVGRRRVDPAG